MFQYDYDYGTVISVDFCVSKPNSSFPFCHTQAQLTIPDHLHPYRREFDSISGMSMKLWHNCGEPQFGVVFSQKLCCGVHFPKIVVGVGVVVIKSKNCGSCRGCGGHFWKKLCWGWGRHFWKNCVGVGVVNFRKIWLGWGCGALF